MIIGIVTPSFRREKLLRRFLRRIPRQTYRNWRLVVVHDGPNPAVESLVGQARARDDRIAFSRTEHTTANYGSSPRAEGVRYMIREVRADYCVFWDDDNDFSKHALKWIVDAIEEARRPDLLLVPFRKSRQILPRPGASIAQLTWGDVDTACLVVRPEVAHEAYEDILDKDSKNYSGTERNQDFRLFRCIRDSGADRRILLASCRPIGLHDGLRIPAHIRGLLRLPPLGIAPWFFRRDSWSP